MTNKYCFGSDFIEQDNLGYFRLAELDPFSDLRSQVFQFALGTYVRDRYDNDKNVDSWSPEALEPGTSFSWGKAEVSYEEILLSGNRVVQHPCADNLRPGLLLTGYTG